MFVLFRFGIYISFWLREREWGVDAANLLSILVWSYLVSSKLSTKNSYHLHCNGIVIGSDLSGLHNIKIFITLLKFIEFLSSLNSVIKMKLIQVCKSFSIWTIPKLYYIHMVSPQYKFLHDKEELCKGFTILKSHTGFLSSHFYWYKETSWTRHLL